MQVRKFCVLLAIVLLLALSACQAENMVTPAVIETEKVAAPTPPITPVDRSQYEEIFDIVWGTVNEMYFDPTMNGVDWEAVRGRYRPEIIAARDDEAFYITLNKMCFELGVSHIFVIPADSPEMMDPVMSAPGSVGIDVRMIDKQVVVVDVEAGSPAELAGLHPGDTILAIDGKLVADVDEWVTFRLPPFNERRYNGQFIGSLQSKLFGEVGEEVGLTHVDEYGRIREVVLTRQDRGASQDIGENLPPAHIRSESYLLDNGIGYIQFNAFFPPILDEVLDAIEEMRDAPGMIIDLRGNPGGFYPVRKAIASQFFQERTLLWRYITRPGMELPGFEHEAYTDPPEEAYLGTVVVLVDPLSASSSEEFAGVMQSSHRATIIGQQTPGLVLVADIVELPNAAIFLYPIAQTQTADGTVLEGRGVTPDITVALDRGQLLQGVDAQVQAAVNYILSQTEKRCQ